MGYYFDPMLVNNVDGVEDSDEEFVFKWKKIRALEPSKKAILVSKQTVEVLIELARKYKLSDKEISEISRIVRDIFFNNINNQNFIANNIDSKIHVGLPISLSIAKEIIEKILDAKIPEEVDLIGEKTIENKTIEISLLYALKQYSQLGEQLVTSFPLKLRIFPSPVRPSIKNWIEDYRSEMGAQRHGMMERGNYLFHSANTKLLSAGERKKLAEILRSLDEDVALKINPDRQEVVFEDIPVFASQAPKPVNPVTAPNTQNFQPAPAANRPQIQNQTPIPNSRMNAFTGNLQNPKVQIENEQNHFFSRYREQNEAHNIEPRNTEQQTVQKPSEQTLGGNINFSSPHVFPSERKENLFGNNQVAPASSTNIPPVVKRAPAYPSLAGKSWEEINIEPKIKGNVVDLKY